MNERNIAKKFGGSSPVFSVEFFPPKTEEGARQILRTAAKLRDVSPDYVSITYGAGGSSRERTMDYGLLLRDIFGYVVMPHLTCVGHSKAEIAEIVEKLSREGISNIMALRGDPPKNMPDFRPSPDGYAHANELVAFIRQNYPNMGIGCAGYPEKHPEAPSIEADIANLKRKVDCGADFVVSQLFYDNAHFFEFVEKCRAAGIDKPMIAGLMPALSLKQVLNFKNMCGTDIPRELLARLESAKDDADAKRIGLDWSRAQIDSLKASGVAAGIHLYILNRAESALELCRYIR